MKLSPESMVAWIEQVWFGDDPEGRGEIGDAVRLSIRNLLIAHQFMVKLIATDNQQAGGLGAALPGKS